VVIISSAVAQPAAAGYAPGWRGPSCLSSRGRYEKRLALLAPVFELNVQTAIGDRQGLAGWPGAYLKVSCIACSNAT
jgi:hypothetical protein